MTIVSPAPKPVSTSPLGTAPPPDARAWYVLAALCFVYVLNFLDRQLLSILAKPIQDDLGVTDGQLGLISGLYFALFYCFISIPVAWLADRGNRVRVLSIACALWSAATVACGLSATYPQLVIARMTVGVGEAGGVPPSYAIITDYFPPGRRGAALGLFNLGPPLGQALGVAFGASIAAAYSWRRAFLVLGMFGVAAALIVWTTIREPKRGGLDAVPAGAHPTEPAPAKAGFLETVAMFFRRPALLLMALACGATQFVTYAVMNFTVLFLMREKGMSLQQVALYYALLIGIGISIGMYVSGRLIDRFTRRSKQAYALVPALGLAGAVPFFVGFVWAPGWPLALLLLVGPTILNYFFLSPAVTLVQEEVRPNQRVLSGALLLLVMNLIGLGFGPTYLGAASDHFRAVHPGNSLQLAFYTLVPFYFLAIALFLALARVLKGEANRTGGH
ncbi:MFS transporter [Nitrospirillum sp. BR 11164]|uniref:spinster family MFS transporter n=1 Tax=Nitrospirillum sp. BR 11164 TaxID=3104324 RepID=UPI002AFEDC7C|nr:MFS transporter [Nitrospirillum sp. BR 11164]MEA1648549.1 MFS transporter [Nitrospirillum sp. BR 11164]